MNLPLFPVLIVLWVITALLLIRAVLGGERWHRQLTSHVRPGVPEPDDAGYALLAWRSWIIALAALVIVLPVSLDSLRVSNDELYEATERGVDLVGELDVSPERIEAQIEVLLGREVTLVDVSVESETSDPQTEEAFDVVVGDDEDGSLDERDPAELPGPVVCVTIRTYASADGATYSVSTASFPCTP